MPVSERTVSETVGTPDGATYVTRTHPLIERLASYVLTTSPIDVVISRTLVYGALAAFITAVYVGIVVGIGTLLGSGGQPNLALSIVATAIVAVAFQLLVRAAPVGGRQRSGLSGNGRRCTRCCRSSERVAESHAANDVLPWMARAAG